MKKADITISVLLIALGCGAFWVASTEYGDGTQYTPMIYSAALIALSLVALAYLAAAQVFSLLSRSSTRNR